MREIIKPIFEWLTGNYNLFDNAIYNYVVMAVVGLLAFAIARKIVGVLYEDDIINGKVAGSIIHWIIRFIVFIILFSAISVLIWLIKLILFIPVWLWWSLLGAFVLVIIGILVRYFLKKDSNLNKAGNSTEN